MTAAQTPAELAAARAWHAAFYAVPPMPPGVALDMVQDEVSDRVDAFMAIMRAAGDDLAGRLPIAPSDDASLLEEQAVLIVAYVRGFAWGMVETHRRLLRELLNRVSWQGLQFSSDRSDVPDYDYAKQMVAWELRARRVVALCREIEDAV